MFDLQEELKKLPDRPGVYIMKADQDEIIYVGKAISLKNRVRQYFQSSKNMHLKVRAMVGHIKEFEYIIVDNEVEALILESNLIKKHRPKYNILLRDDKQYPYIKITNEKFPRLIKTRQVLKDGAKYYGPYPNANAVNLAINILHDIYPLRTCRTNFSKKQENLRPCLNYHLGKCLGVCIGKVDEKDYNEIIKEVKQFLSGRDDRVFNSLEEKMNAASLALDFEKAATYRDQLEALNILMEKQKIVRGKEEDQDIIGMARGIEEVCIQIFFIRNGKILGREHFLLADTFSSEKKEIISSFIKQFYIASSYIPKEILTEEDLEDKEIIEKWLSQKKEARVKITSPQRGEKSQLLEMVKENAKDMLDKYGDKFLKKHRENIKALEEIQDLLELEELPKRIEAFDISNISGAQSVASMVVFENGQAKKSFYRRFRIKGISGPDDYASIEEVIRRRFTRGLEEKAQLNETIRESKGFSIMPDMVMVDGGKGQVNIASKVVEDLGLNISILGLVKDDFHVTRGIIYENKEYRLDIDSLGYRLIYKIQEEAHRFAISYHRSLRSKDMLKSQLDNIRGIGIKRKTGLMKHFQSIDKIKNASIEELSKVEGMNKKVASDLYMHFREEETKTDKIKD